MDRLFENFVRDLLSLYNDDFSIERGSHIVDIVKNRVVIVHARIYEFTTQKILSKDKYILPNTIKKKSL